MRTRFVQTIPEAAVEAVLHDWPVWARPGQRPALSDWRTWLVLGGRGAGKTRIGAEWVRGVATADGHQPGDAAGRIALIGRTYADARDVMVEGESGILQAHPKHERPVWRVSKRELEWPNGAIAQLFSAADPDGIRGSQFGAAWCDEIAKWGNLEHTWNMLQFALRLGSWPRQVVTTTPKPLRLLKQLVDDPGTIVTRAPTWENEANLAPSFLEYVASRYRGTALGRQELEGEILEEAEHALWTRKIIDRYRLGAAPELRRIVIAVDPPGSTGRNSAACGIVVAGKTDDGRCIIMADATLERASPKMWASRVRRLFEQYQADRVVAEVNQGGNMVEEMLKFEGSHLPVLPVHASRGKWVRAEPVALLYEQGLVSHVGSLAELEDQMCAFGPDGMAEGVSPDRVDALVWAVSELMLKTQVEPRIHVT